MGFSCLMVWVMGYCGPMGYGIVLPANQVGGPLRLWTMRGYGLSEVWVKRGLTVPIFVKRRRIFNLLDLRSQYRKPSFDELLTYVFVETVGMAISFQEPLESYAW